MSSHSANHANFFATCNTLFCVVGFEGSFRQTNAAWENLLGYSWEEVRDTPFLEFVHPEDREETARVLEQLAQDVDTLVFANRFRHHNGEYRDFIWQATASIMEFGFYAVGMDTSNYKAQVEKATSLDMQEDYSILHEKYADLELDCHERLKNIQVLGHVMANIEEGVLAQYGNGDIVALNPRAEAILGEAAAEVDFKQIWQAGQKKTDNPEPEAKFFYHKIGSGRPLLKLKRLATSLELENEPEETIKIVIFQKVKDD